MRIIGDTMDLLFGKVLPADRGDIELPDGVVLREGALIPRIGGIFGRLRGPAAAVTLGRTIIVRPGARISDSLLRHELVHVRQWSEDWFFPLKYAVESMRHGYYENAYECEAREAEASADRNPPKESTSWPIDPS